MDELNIKYKFEDNFNPTYVNGAMGGINPLGEIFLNFYLERRPIPKSTTIKLKDGMPTSEIIAVSPPDYGNSMIRYVENGVIMSYSAAKDIHRLLGEQLENFEKNTITK